jgi:hypothetical protein
MKSILHNADLSILKSLSDGATILHVFILENKSFKVSRTSQPISIKLGTNYSWVKGSLFKDRDNKNAKIQS